MSDREQIKIDSFRVSGPVQGKRIEVEFDVKPARRRGKSSYYSSSDDWNSIFYLFFLLFSLVFFVGNTVGTSPTPFPDALYPSNSGSSSFVQPNP